MHKSCTILNLSRLYAEKDPIPFHANSFLHFNFRSVHLLESKFSRQR